MVESTTPSNTLVLLYHPDRSEIERRLSLPLGHEERFGVYAGSRDEPLGQGRRLQDFLEVLHIEPLEIEPRAELGRFVVHGATREGERVDVEIDPFAEEWNHGEIIFIDRAEPLELAED